MTPLEHRREAERLLDVAAQTAMVDRATLTLIRAQVHATLWLGSQVSAGQDGA